MTDPTSVTPVADVRALVPTLITDAQLLTVILREEAALAREITDLDGERTETFAVGERGLWIEPTIHDLRNVWFVSERLGPLGLQRPTDAVTVIDNGLTLGDDDVRLFRQGTLVERATGGWTGPIVTVTYTPNDLLEVQRVVIELCRMTLTETGYQSEQIGDYKYAKHLRPAPGEIDPRKALVRSLRTHLRAGLMTVRASTEDDRIGAVE